VDFVAFSEEELGEVGSVLAGHSCNQGFLQTLTLLRGRVGQGKFI
jgi:hypothetical protein